jgi:glycosyltransferase involved in cell wall biosynthesis
MILHVLANDGPGGTQAVTVGHADVLAGARRSQLVVFMMSPTGDTAVLDALKRLGVGVRYLLQGNTSLSSAVDLARLCRRERVDTVFTHGLGFHLVVAAAARVAGVRRVVVLVGNPIATDIRTRRRVRWRSRLAVPLVERIVACSQHVADDVCLATGLSDSRVSVIANPLDVRVIRARADAVRASRRESHPAVVCMVARLDPIKDHASVLSAVAMLREEGRDVSLRLAGSGPTEADLVLLADRLGISDFVEFLGDRSDIPELLGSSDVFAYGMTWSEGYGVAVAEAMAAGVPIVCMDEGPAREVLDGGRGGRLVPSGDVAAMADAIARLLDHPAEAEELAAAAFDICLRRHDRASLEGHVRELAGLS